LGLVAKYDVNAACCESEDTYDVVHNLVGTSLEGCCDLYVYEESFSLDCDNVFANHLCHSHVSPMCSQPSFSPKYYSDVPMIIL